MALRTGHVGINVTDLDHSRPFYVEVFGLEVCATAGGATERAVAGAAPSCGFFG